MSTDDVAPLSGAADQKAANAILASQVEAAAAPAVLSQLLQEVLATSELGANGLIGYQQASRETLMADSSKRESFLSIIAEWASVSIALLTISSFVAAELLHLDLSTSTIVAPLFSVTIGALVTICLRFFLAR